MFFRLRFQMQRLDFLSISFQFLFGVALSKFVLQNPDLGSQNLFPVVLYQRLPDFAFHLMFKAEDAALPRKQGIEFAQTDKRRKLF